MINVSRSSVSRTNSFPTMTFKPKIFVKHISRSVSPITPTCPIQLPQPPSNITAEYILRTASRFPPTVSDHSELSFNAGHIHAPSLHTPPPCPSVLLPLQTPTLYLLHSHNFYHAPPPRLNCPFVLL